MAFAQATILSVSPPQVCGSQVYVSWTSSSPAGTWFQVYVNQRPAWTGHGARRGSPSPPDQCGSTSAPLVPASRIRTSPPRSARVRRGGCSSPGSRAPTRVSTWRAFGCTGPTAPGGPVDNSTALADITAYPLGIDTAGFGLGGFGSGGFGQLAGNYSWTSGPLAAGTWTFAVVSLRRRGERGLGAADDR